MNLPEKSIYCIQCSCGFSSSTEEKQAFQSRRYIHVPIIVNN
jgi:hypothetical protein